MPPSVMCPRCAPSDSRTSACAAALQCVHAAAATNAARTPSGGHSAAGPSTRAVSRWQWGTVRAVQNLCAKRHAYNVRTAMLVVLAHTSTASPAPDTCVHTSVVSHRGEVELESAQYLQHRNLLVSRRKYQCSRQQHVRWAKGQEEKEEVREEEGQQQFDSGLQHKTLKLNAPKSKFSRIRMISTPGAAFSRDLEQ